MIRGLPCYNNLMNSHQHMHDATGHDKPRTNTTQRDELVASTSPSAMPTITFPEQPQPPIVPESASFANSNPNETPRHDAIERDQARPDADSRDEPRTDATVSQTVLQDQPVKAEEPETTWLDVEQAAAHLSEKGISRTIRTIQRLCKRGDLIAKLVPTENSARYIISERSLGDYVTRHNEKLPSGSLDPDQSTNSLAQHSPEDAELQAESSKSGGLDAVSSSNASIHLREIIDLKDQQIAMMQSQIDTANAQLAVKDEQIATMHERDHETNVLIQNLQNLLALPEARSARNDNNAITMDQG